MAKNLVIVESPAKARTIGRFLGRNYAVKASIGHVRDLPERTLGVDVKNDFEPKYVVPEEKKALIKELDQALQKADALYLATDPDREGEAIAWHLSEAIKTGKKPVRRVVFHEITKPAIGEAFEHPREINVDLVNAPADAAHPRPVGRLPAEPAVGQEGAPRPLGGTGAVGRAPDDRRAGTGDREVRPGRVLAHPGEPGEAVGQRRQGQGLRRDAGLGEGREGQARSPRREDGDGAGRGSAPLHVTRSPRSRSGRRSAGRRRRSSRARSSRRRGASCASRRARR